MLVHIGNMLGWRFISMYIVCFDLSLAWCGLYWFIGVCFDLSLAWCGLYWFIGVTVYEFNMARYGSILRWSSESQQTPTNGLMNQLILFQMVRPATKSTATKSIQEFPAKPICVIFAPFFCMLIGCYNHACFKRLNGWNRWVSCFQRRCCVSTWPRMWCWWPRWTRCCRWSFASPWPSSGLWCAATWTVDVSGEIMSLVIHFP